MATAIIFDRFQNCVTFSNSGHIQAIHTAITDQTQEKTESFVRKGNPWHGQLWNLTEPPAARNKTLTMLISLDTPQGNHLRVPFSFPQTYLPKLPFGAFFMIKR